MRPIFKLAALMTPCAIGHFCLPGGQSMNKRKPDLLWVLVFIFGLGVVTTGYAQSLWERKLDAAYQTPVAQVQTPR